MPTRSNLNRLPPPLSEKERFADLERILDTRPSGHEFWVFAYGSLIWNPCFGFDVKETMTLTGYRRAFNFWSVVSRGTLKSPGLGLGLEDGGQCRGVAFRLNTETLFRDLDALWKRELYHGVYRSRWLALDSRAGAIPAVTFITNPDHPHFAGDLSLEDAACIIARARGENGSCSEYLAETVTALADHGISDDALSRLLALVERENA